MTSHNQIKHSNKKKKLETSCILCAALRCITRANSQRSVVNEAAFSFMFFIFLFTAFALSRCVPHSHCCEQQKRLGEERSIKAARHSKRQERGGRSMPEVAEWHGETRAVEGEKAKRTPGRWNRLSAKQDVREDVWGGVAVRPRNKRNGANAGALAVCLSYNFPSASFRRWHTAEMGAAMRDERPNSDW